MKNRKLLRNIFLSIALIFVVILFFTSTVARWYVQKNSEALIGRKIEIGELHLNYLTVSINIQDFALYEKNKVDTFVSFKQFYVNIQPWRMIKHEYALNKFLLDGLNVQIEQDSNKFNFDDIIPPTDTTLTDTSTNKNNIQFSFKNISIQNSNFNYLDKEIDNLISLHNLNLQLPLLAWNNKKSEVGIEFIIGEKGYLQINADVNNENKTYSVQTQIDSLDLNLFSAYSHPYLNTSEIKGFFSSNISVKGSMTNYMHVIVTGNAKVFDFTLPDEKGTPIFSAKSLAINLDSIDIQNQYFGLNTIKLDSPQIWLKKGEEINNIEHLLAPLTSIDSTEIADTSIAAKSDTSKVYYNIDSVRVSRGEIYFEDNSITRPFNYTISSIDLSMAGISEVAENVPVAIDMVLNNKGTFNGEAGINMLNPQNISFSGDIDNLELLSFSPYSEDFVAHPIIQGEFDYHIDIDMTASELINNNKIRIKELEFGEKVPDITAIKTPIRLALYIIKDKDDNIAIDLPVSGNPSDPDFSLGKLLLKTFSNFIIKTATEPFSALASIVGTDPESIRQVKFAPTQDTLSTEQRITLNKLGEILQNKPEFIFTLTQETPSQTEINELAVKQIIIDYLLKTNQANTATDTLLLINKWNTIERNNTEFTKYVNTLYTQSDSLEFEDKCLSIIGKEKVELQFNQLLKHRNIIINNYLSKNLQVNNANFIVRTADLVNMRTQFEVPIYRIEVSIQ